MDKFYIQLVDGQPYGNPINQENLGYLMGFERDPNTWTVGELRAANLVPYQFSEPPAAPEGCVAESNCTPLWDGLTATQQWVIRQMDADEAEAALLAKLTREKAEQEADFRYKRKLAQTLIEFGLLTEDPTEIQVVTV